MVRHLVVAREATARTARELPPLVNAANDQPTADLLAQRLEVHEKTAWMLRSLLEDLLEPTGQLAYPVAVHAPAIAPRPALMPFAHAGSLPLDFSS
jgi:hypothetical protein